MDISPFTIKQLKEFCKNYSIPIPSGLKRHELILYIYAFYTEYNSGISSSNFTPLTIHQRPPTPTYVDSSIPWIQHLHVHGWTVVPIPDFDPQYYVNCFWSFLESCHPQFNRHDSTTWLPSNMPVLHHGIFKQYIGHTSWMWDIRQKCKPLFEHLWNTTDLLCSFDGACFFKPFKPSSSNSPKYWIHSDQGSFSLDFCCVQGIVNLLDNGPDDGGLVIVQNSHNVFSNYLQRHPTQGFSWFHVDMTDPLVSSLPLLKICAPPGHIILFDSRVFHCNIPPSGTSCRMATYVSMQPRSGSDPSILQKRIISYEHGRMTGHWCYGPWFSLNPKHPHTYGATNNCPSDIEIATLNPIQRRLVGYDI